MMPSVSIFGPLLEIGPRVLLVMACGLLVLVALRMSGRAIRERCAGLFVAGWALGIVGACAARIGCASLAFHGSPAMSRGLPDPLSGAEIWRFLPAGEAPIALAVGSGLLIALWLRPWPRSRCDRGVEPRSTLAADRRGGRGAGGWRAKGDRAARASQCHSLGGGVVGRARSRRSSTLGDRSAGNQDARRNDRRRTLRQLGHSAPPAVSRSAGWTIQCCRTRRMCGQLKVLWAICGCRYAVTWSRPAALGLRRRSRTRSFPSGICHGCCRFPLPSRTRAFSMRRGGGSSARRRRAVAAVRRTRPMRDAGGRRSGFGGRRNRLDARYSPDAPEGGLPRRDLGRHENCPQFWLSFDGATRGRSPAC